MPGEKKEIEKRETRKKGGENAASDNGYDHCRTVSIFVLVFTRSGFHSDAVCAELYSMRGGPTQRCGAKLRDGEASGEYQETFS